MSTGESVCTGEFVSTGEFVGTGEFVSTGEFAFAVLPCPLLYRDKCININLSAYGKE